MAMSSRASLVLVLALSAPAAMAEERFYPIMGPDGRVQMIRSETPAKVSPSAAPAVKEPAAAEAPAVAPPSRDAPAITAPDGSAVAPGPAGGAAPAVELPHAAYDSDEYVDSEAMEAANKPAAAGRKRFYMVRDGMGEYLSEPEADTAEPAAPAPVRPSAEAGVRWEALTATGVIWTPAEAAVAMPWLPACLEARDRAQWPTLLAGEGQDAVVDRPDLALIGRQRVHSGWRLEGEGPRTLLVNSYASSQRKPAFLDPRLAFLDGRGCVTRIVQGWFDRRYAANDRRHAFLRADLVVHSEEEAVLLLLPPEQDKLAASGPWQSSRTGQLKFTLKK